jgi:hypothetical protein
MQDYIPVVCVTIVPVTLPVGCMQVQLHGARPDCFANPDFCIRKIRALIGILMAGKNYLQGLAGRGC